MSSISLRLSFYKCAYDNVAQALCLRNFSMVLSDYDASFDYYGVIKEHEERTCKFIPIMQVCKEVNVESLRKAHTLNVHNDPNTKLRIRALSSGAADATSQPFSTVELFIRLGRLADRIDMFTDAKEAAAKIQAEREASNYKRLEAGYGVIDDWFVCDYDTHLCSAAGHYILLSQRERVLLKALCETNGEPAGRKYLCDYMADRGVSGSYNTLGQAVYCLNAKLRRENASFRIRYVKLRGYDIVRA